MSHKPKPSPQPQPEPPAAVRAAEHDAPFWRVKSLAAMTDVEWESLCDGCGRCCLLKLQDEETDRIYYTDVACRLFDQGTCRCSDYPNRQAHVPDCVRLTPEVVDDIGWLPPTCGYRLVAEAKDLPWWHPLVSGDPETVVTAGVSVRGRVSGSETDISPYDLEEHVVDWPVMGVRRKPGPKRPPAPKRRAP